MNPSPNWQALEKNICDTLKEWELKIGYSKESAALYYPAESLCALLGLPKGQEERLKEALTSFCKKVRARLGEVRITFNQERYCIHVSEAGSRYVKDHIQASPFLVKFIEEIRRPGSSLASVEQVFGNFSSRVVKRQEEDAYIFYFQDAEVDEYVYCVKEDAFGLEYHRFTREDYRSLYGSQLSG
ncbi:DUF3877 family protein [Lachnospiraceae bacterium 45-W7]